MTSRLPDWQVRFESLIHERRAAPFEFGRQDCSLFAADAVLAVTGADPASAFRGQYDTALGAARVLREAGGVRAIAAATLGEEISPQLAAVGDIGLHFVAGAEALAVCGGAYWFAAGPDGLVPLPVSEMRTAWRCA